MARIVLLGGDGQGGSETGQYIIDSVNSMTLELYNFKNNSCDYIIEKINSTTYARPKTGSNLSLISNDDSYIVIQGAITALTPTGSLGTGGGHIHITKGTYTLTNELIINGWESTFNPSSQLLITGDGLSTVLFQNTSAKNGLVVKNAACFGLKDIKISCGGSAKSALLLDSTGIDYERSCMKSIIDNVQLEASNTSFPAGYFKNFFYLTIGKITLSNSNFSAFIVENASATASYGNSNWSEVLCFANTSSPNAGIKFISSGSSGGQGMGMLSIEHYECHSAYYGIYAEALSNTTFNLIDSEATNRPIYLIGGSGLGEIQNIKILNSYLLVNSTDVAITTGLFSRECDINAHISCGASGVPLIDLANFRPPNKFRLNLENDSAKANITIARPEVTDIEILSTSNNNIYRRLPNLIGIGTTYLTHSSLALYPSTTTIASLFLPVGSPPDTPIDGQIWRQDNTNTGLKIRINGVTKTITLS